MKRLVIIMLLFLLYTSIPAAGSQETIGKSLYQKYCANCHGEDGAGTPYGRELHTPVRDLRQNYLLSSEKIKYIIRYGLFERELLDRKETFTDTDIENLKEYVRTFTYNSSKKTGRKLFVRFCSICHGKNAEGDENFVTFDLRAGAVSMADMRNMIREGRHDTAMVNKRRRLTNKELADLLAYIISIRNDKADLHDNENVHSPILDMSQ